MSSDANESLTLRVAKAIPSDVGHGRARVPFDNDLNLNPETSSRLKEKGRLRLLFGDADRKMLTLESFELME